jgi:NADPH-ferrihemoprotein reductase
MDQMSVSDLAKWENVLLVTSTFGVGEFPSNALNFWNDLADDSLPGDMLANTKYSVFGIGSCTYKYYCKAAELLHERFEQLGAESLADCENADTAGPGSHWANFDPWATNVVSALGGSGFSLLEPPTPKYRVSAGLSTSYNEKARLPAPDHHFAPLVKSELVTKEGYPIKRRLFEIDLENTGLSYKTGDHVSIMPRNDPIRVANFLDFYGLPGDMSINIGPLETTQFFSSCQTMDFPPSLTVRELFEQYIDLASGPTRKFMRELALFATNSTERDELLFLADPDNKEAYLNYFANNTLEDTMRRYSSAAPPLDQIVSMAPVIAPRLYSIASAPELVGDKLQLLIALLEWNTPEGTRRTGLTTEYLFRLNAEEKPMVPVSIRKGMLLPPEDPQTPVVMFGLGTGLAPFRGFMQQREAFLSEGKKLGDALLYFGCRNEDGDYVCREEIEGWKKSGALTDVVVGFSHDQKEPIWMDEEIMKQPEVAWRTAKQDGVHMYYCGPAMGIPERLMGAIKHSGQTVGLMNEDAINAWEQRLDTSNPETNRWHVESF